MIKFLLDVPSKRVVIVSSATEDIKKVWDFDTVFTVIWVHVNSDHLISINHYEDEVRIHVDGSVSVYNDENNWKVVNIG